MRVIKPSIFLVFLVTAGPGLGHDNSITADSSHSNGSHDLVHKGMRKQSLKKFEMFC